MDIVFVYKSAHSDFLASQRTLVNLELLYAIDHRHIPLHNSGSTGVRINYLRSTGDVNGPIGLPNYMYVPETIYCTDKRVNLRGSRM